MVENHKKLRAAEVMLAVGEGVTLMNVNLVESNEIIRAAEIMLGAVRGDMTFDEFCYACQDFKHVLVNPVDRDVFELVVFVMRLMLKQKATYWADKRESLDRAMELARAVGADVVYEAPEESSLFPFAAIFAPLANRRPNGHAAGGFSSPPKGR